MKRLVVYGTLRTGGYFSPAMPKEGKVEVHKINGVRVYETTSFFPGAHITGDQNDYVVAEVWDYSGHLSNEEWEQLILNLDRIEGVNRKDPDKGLFRCEEVDTPLGRAFIYVMNHPSLVEPTMNKNVVVNDWAEIDKGIRLPGGENVKIKKGKNSDRRRRSAGKS